MARETGVNPQESLILDKAQGILGIFYDDDAERIFNELIATGRGSYLSGKLDELGPKVAEARSANPGSAIAGSNIIAEWFGKLEAPGEDLK